MLMTTYFNEKIFLNSSCTLHTERLDSLHFLLQLKAIGIFQDFAEGELAPLKYLLTYTLSQGHLELFFGAIRAAGGFNNNPTVQQFTAAYKRLLCRIKIFGGYGNCQPQDETKHLCALDNICTVCNQVLTIFRAALIGKHDLSERKPLQVDHDYRDSPNMAYLSEFKQAAISDIAGYVAKMTLKQLLCATCSEALGLNSHPANSSFLKQRDRGGLFKPIQSVVIICEETERRCMRMLCATGRLLPQGKEIPEAVALSMLGEIKLTEISRELDGHMLDTAVNENHVFGLTMLISINYCSVRRYHFGKKCNQQIAGNKIRKKLNNWIKHQ